MALSLGSGIGALEDSLPSLWLKYLISVSMSRLPAQKISDLIVSLLSWSLEEVFVGNNDPAIINFLGASTTSFGTAKSLINTGNASSSLQST